MEKYLGIGFIVFCISFLIWWYAVGYSISSTIHGGDGELLGFAFGWVGAIPCALITAILWPILLICLAFMALMALFH